MTKGNVVEVVLVAVVVFLLLSGHRATAFFLGGFALPGRAAATLIERRLAGAVSTAGDLEVRHQ